MHVAWLHIIHIIQKITYNAVSVNVILFPSAARYSANSTNRRISQNIPLKHSTAYKHGLRHKPLSAQRWTHTLYVKLSYTSTKIAAYVSRIEIKGASAIYALIT